MCSRRLTCQKIIFKNNTIQLLLVAMRGIIAKTRFTLDSGKFLSAKVSRYTVFTIPLQPCSHIVYSFTMLSQACHNLATTLSRPCSIFTIRLQPCNHIVYSSQGYHKLVTTLPQPCHDLVVVSQSNCNLAATLSDPSQGCHKLVTSLSTLPQPYHNLVVYS